jgi:sortase B
MVGKGVRMANRLLNLVVGFILLAAFLYSLFGLIDTWLIYKEAGLDSELMKYKPSIGDGGANPSLADLQEINPDVCGWLTVDGTNIDYPLVHSHDNIEYLNLDIYGKFSLSGCIFLDYRNQSDFSDNYSVIYGHHMAGDVMFGELPYFLGASYFQEHTTGTLFLPERTCEIEWFASLEADAFDEYMFGFVGEDAYRSSSQMQNLLTNIREKASQYRDIGVTTSDHLIALSTCSEAATNGRTLLIGRISQ